MTRLPTLATCHGVAWLMLALLVACAHRPHAASPQELLHDELYVQASPPVDKTAIFALSDAMRRYADNELAPAMLRRDPQRALIDALYKQGRLRLSYDAAITRNAAQAFEARAGNCLSLVIMTAAFARYQGMPVSYQRVQMEEVYTRSGDLTIANGHVNLVLGRQSPHAPFGTRAADALTVDFLPASELGSQRTQPLPESTVVAMYLNNRAAEALAADPPQQAYHWAREAVLHEPGYAPAVNTLAVVYLRDGHLREAETALRHVLTEDPTNTSALSNLVLVLRRAGRDAEATTVALRLAQLEPVPPFRDYELGRQAMARGDYIQARDLFLHELDRQPDQSEVHFWVAQALWRLGDETRALQHLRLAIENSTTAGTRNLYAAKLEHLRALHARANERSQVQ